MSTGEETGEEDLPLAVRLNLQTAPITWPELERFFARGRVLHVDATLDLVAVAAALVEDRMNLFQSWTDKGTVKHLPDDIAKQWVLDDRNLWAVVVAPWVLVQHRLPQNQV